MHLIIETNATFSTSASPSASTWLVDTETGIPDLLFLAICFLFFSAIQVSFEAFHSASESWIGWSNSINIKTYCFSNFLICLMRVFFCFWTVIFLTCISFLFIHHIFIKFFFVCFFSSSVFFCNLTANAMFRFFLINFNFFDWSDFNRLRLIFLFSSFWFLHFHHRCSFCFWKMAVEIIFLIELMNVLNLSTQIESFYCMFRWIFDFYFSVNAWFKFADVYK